MCEFMLTVIGKNFNRRKPSMDHWKNFSVGSSACHLAVSQIQKRNELDVELTFDWLIDVMLKMKKAFKKYL